MVKIAECVERCMYVVEDILFFHGIDQFYYTYKNSLFQLLLPNFPLSFISLYQSVYLFRTRKNPCMIHTLIV